MKRIITTLSMAVFMTVTSPGEICYVPHGRNLSGQGDRDGTLWSMEQCMAYAAEHASSVKQARWDVASATAERNEAFADFFPSVAAQLGTQFNWGRNIDPETNTYNDVTTFNNGYGIYASITLFDGGQTLNRYRQARSERERYLNTVEMKRDDSAMGAMMAFADAVYYHYSIKIAEERLNQSEEVLRLAKTQEELGIAGRPDVAQAEATVANDRYQLLHNRNLHSQAMLSLKSAMNLPLSMELLIDTAYMTDKSRMLLTGYDNMNQSAASSGTDNAESIFETALLTNPKSVDARMQVKSRKYAYDVAKGNMLPSISLNAGISTSYYKILGAGFPVPSFGEQFRNNRGEYVSATLSIPIFSNLRRLSAKNRAKYAYEQAKERLEDEQRKLHDEVMAAVRDREGYAMEVASLSSKTEADAEAYRLNLRKYEEGLLSLIDLQLSANTYYTSRVELLRTRMLYILKNKLVEYYKGNRLWM